MSRARTLAGAIGSDGALNVADVAGLAAFDLYACQQNRKMEYPPITDYIDGVVKGDQEQIQAYIDACLAVKDKYPKP